MIHSFSEGAEAAVIRYSSLLNILRGQSETLFRRGSNDEELRMGALRVAQDAARSFVNAEHAEINDDTTAIARLAYKQALTDLELPEATIEDRFSEFIFASAQYISRILAAQAERDVMTMAQHNQSTALRIDMYVRSGRHSISTASAQVMIENNQSPAFKFIDRLGRHYKASKHIRDIYRQHLLNIYNEVYMDVVATHGHNTVFVSHPDPGYKWFAEELVIVTGSDTDGLPLYYDVRAEIFHPSSQANLTIIEQD